ncbi:MAG TPA: tetratricopeptide repeat protein, partial [Steroidobacteraceae bacterium]|nr:tetratricopeptide repeat protein [Steroidobacteraceae bacterium]
MNALQAHSDRRSAREVTPADLSRLVAAANAGRYRDMERLAHELVGACRHSGVAWKALSASLEMQGKDSLAASERAAHLLPNDAEVYSNLGSALRRVGRLDESVGSYRRALAINPSIAEVWNNLGNALRDLGKLNDAVAAFRRALDLKPEFAKPYNNLGNALQDLGKLDEAVASYRRALELKPDYAEAHNNLAIALRSQNRTAE